MRAHEKEYLNGKIQALSEAEEQIRTFWNDSTTMINQKEQARMSGDAIKRMRENEERRLIKAMAEPDQFDVFEPPVPMILVCPQCGARHIDVGEFEMKVHHTHACQECGMVWRPAIVPTVGVQFLPGFKNQ